MDDETATYVEHTMSLNRIEAKLDELLALLRPKPICDDEMAKIGELRVLIGSGMGALDAKVSDLKGWPWRTPVHDPNGGRR